MNEDRFDALERRVAQLESRIEGRGGSPQATRDASPRAHGAPSLAGVLQGWRRVAREQSLPGTVGYAGAAYLAGGGEYLWTRQQSLGELLPADWSPAAGVLESLGSMPRLALLAALLREGRRTSAELQEALGGEEGEATSGHLYHHLRALQAARLIVSRRRGEYEIAPQAVIPILAILAAALNLAADPPIGPLPGIPGSDDVQPMS
jgi:DNA-binding transcriptional ArsR family regulator